ncbi:MAG: hypothetical protein Q9217_004689 [Psora testacea]
MKSEHTDRLQPFHQPILVKSSRWVIAVEKKNREAGESIFDDEATVDVSYTTRAWRLREGLPSLDLATIKDFLRFIAAVSHGIIDDEEEVVTFFAGFARVTGNHIEEEDRRAVYHWVRNTMITEGLVVNKKKPKHLFGEKELVQFSNTFWTVDDDKFTHLRNKVQIPFIIAVFCWTGARIGASSPDRKDDNKKGLRYGASLE